MPAKAVSMRKIRELLRLHFGAQLSQYQIAASLHLLVGVVNKYVRRANQQILYKAVEKWAHRNWHLKSP